MSALPDDESFTLPSLSTDDYPSQGYATQRELAALFEVSVPTLRRWMDRPGAPRPVARIEGLHYGRIEFLYSIRAFDHWLALDCNESLHARGLPRPVRVVGTRTPTAGKPYVWRDPLRWKP